MQDSGVNSIKVGIPVSLSGQFRVQGNQALAGLQAWAGDVNREGGLRVRDRRQALPISVVHYDDGSRAEAARSAAERLITDDRVDLLFGPYSSVLTHAAATVAEKYEYVLWNQGGAADGIYRRGNPWVVGILTSASEYLAGLLPLVQQFAPDARTLAIVRSFSGTFPRVVSSGLERQAAALGFDTILPQEYDPAIADFSQILDSVDRARPDVLLAVGRIQNDLLFARQLVARHLPLGVAAVVATPIQQFVDVLGPDVQGFVGPSQWEPMGDHPTDCGPTANQVIDALRRRTSEASETVDYPMVQAYAAGLVAQRCVEEAGTLDQSALRLAASALDFSTFYGRFKIDAESGRQIGRSVVLVQWQHGRKVIVWPPHRQQAPLTYPWRGPG